MKKFNPRVSAALPTKPFNGIAFIGEAPGDEEVIKGAPFVGPSGRIFTQACQVAGIDREASFVGNVFDVQLPDNNIENWCANTAEARKWDGIGLPAVTRGHYLRPEYEGHLARLGKELRGLKPNVIVPMGNTALWALRGHGSIKMHRGALAEARMIVPGAKLLPTFHPAAVLRMYKYFPIMVFDLLKAWGERKSSEIAYTPREILLEPTLDDIRAFKQSVLDAPYLSIDIETIPKFRQITCIGFADSIGRALVVPFCDKRVPNSSYWKTAEEEVEAIELVEELCSLPMPKIGQNFTYDLQWLLERWGVRVRNYVEDTRLMHHALYPELPKDLGFLGSCYAREKSWKTYRGEKAEKRDE